MYLKYSLHACILKYSPSLLLTLRTGAIYSPVSSHIVEITLLSRVTGNIQYLAPGIYVTVNLSLTRDQSYVITARV